MSRIKYFETITNSRGDSLANYRVQVVDSAGAIVTIYQDEAGTRFQDAAGNPVNFTVAGPAGKAEFWWEPASGQILQVLDAAGNLVDATDGFANKYVLTNLPGNIATAAVVGLDTSLAAKAETADLASSDPEKGAALVAYSQPGTGSVARTIKEKVAERLSGADYGVKADGTTDDTANLRTASDTAYGLTQNLSLGSGIHRVTAGLEFPNDRTFEQRGRPFTLEGNGAGTPYISDPKSTIINGDEVDSAQPVIWFRERDNSAAVEGTPPIHTGSYRVEGTTNPGVPLFRADLCPAFGYTHDIAAYQNGTGDGFYFTGPIVSDVRRIFATNTDLVADIPKAARTGVGVSVLPATDYGLADIHGSSRGYQTGWVFGYDIGDIPTVTRNLGLKFRGEISTVGDGIVVKELNESTLLEQPFFEAVTDKGITDNGRFTLTLHPFFSFGVGAANQGVTNVNIEWGVSARSPSLIGGSIPLVESGVGLRIEGAVFGGSVFGPCFVDGGSNSIGIDVRLGSDPRLNIFANFSDGVWVGERVRDISHSSNHGGAEQANGSGVIGVIPRSTRDNALPFQELSRGGYRALFDPVTLTSFGPWSGDTLNLGHAPNYLINTNAARIVNRIAAPNLPDKQGVFFFDGVQTAPCTFRPSVYLTGITVDETIAVGEVALVFYQVTPGPLAQVFIQIMRTMPKKPVHTVATLPASPSPGSTACVSDSSATLAAAIGNTVAGGGANFVPVFYNGSEWKVG